MDLNAWLSEMVKTGASDLFLTVGEPPTLKIQGHFKSIAPQALSKEEVESTIFSLMNEAEKAVLEERKEMNFAIFREGLGRFRVSAFQQRLQKAAVLRRIENQIPTLEALQLPSVLKPLALKKRGLILVVGGAGMGKSTTLAAMIGHRNHSTEGHIICIEDPIEFIHDHDKCIISQREVGMDTDSYEIALKNSLRQAPDVILIGEIRTREVMQYALAFAEMGHLCLATLHANNAHQALERIASFFDLGMLNQLWMDLSLNLKAIVAQQLIPPLKGETRIPAVEVLINSAVISSHIRKGKVDLLKDFMIKGIHEGMQTFDQSLYRLVLEGKISEAQALSHADSENDLRIMLKLRKGASDDSSTTNSLRILNDYLDPNIHKKDLQ